MTFRNPRKPIKKPTLDSRYSVTKHYNHCFLKIKATSASLLKPPTPHHHSNKEVARIISKGGVGNDRLVGASGYMCLVWCWVSMVSYVWYTKLVVHSSSFRVVLALVPLNILYETRHLCIAYQYFYLPRSGKVKYNCRSKRKKIGTYGFWDFETSVFSVIWYYYF